MVAVLLASLLLSPKAPESASIGYLAASSHGPMLAVTVGQTAGSGQDVWLLRAVKDQIQLAARRSYDVGFDTLVFSPDGKYLAAGQRSGSDPADVYLLSTRGLRLIRRLHGCMDYAQIAFSADSKYVYGCAYGAAFKWRTRDGRRVSTWAPFGTTRIYGDMFNSSSQMAKKGNVFSFIVGQYHDELVVADANFRNLLRRKTPLVDVFMPNLLGSRKLALQKANASSLDVTDLTTGERIATVAKQELATEPDNAVVRLSPSGKFAASRTTDRKRIEVWLYVHPEAGWSITPKTVLVRQDYYLVNDNTLAMVSGADFTDAKSGRLLLSLEVGTKAKRPWWRFYDEEHQAMPKKTARDLLASILR